MKLFLDINGTLIVHGADFLPHAADNLDEFLRWALGMGECYWLSGVDQTGSSENILKVLRKSLGKRRYHELQPLLYAIRATRWGRSELDAIDLADPEPWFWVDDNHGKAELVILQSLGLEERAINCPYNGLRQVRTKIEALTASAAFTCVAD
jgi:hypothetical protein